MDGENYTRALSPQQDDVFDIVDFDSVDFQRDLSPSQDDLSRAHSLSMDVARAHSLSQDVDRAHSLSTDVDRAHSLSPDVVRAHSLSTDVERAHSLSSDAADRSSRSSRRLIVSDTTSEESEETELLYDTMEILSKLVPGIHHNLNTAIMCKALVPYILAAFGGEEKGLFKYCSGNQPVWHHTGWYTVEMVFGPIVFTLSPASQIVNVSIEPWDRNQVASKLVWFGATRKSGFITDNYTEAVKEEQKAWDVGLCLIQGLACLISFALKDSTPIKAEDKGKARKYIFSRTGGALCQIGEMGGDTQIRTLTTDQVLETLHTLRAVFRSLPNAATGLEEYYSDAYGEVIDKILDFNGGVTPALSEAEDEITGYCPWCLQTGAIVLSALGKPSRDFPGHEACDASACWCPIDWGRVKSVQWCTDRVKGLTNKIAAHAGYTAHHLRLMSDNAKTDLESGFAEVPAGITAAAGGAVDSAASLLEDIVETASQMGIDAAADIAVTAASHTAEHAINKKFKEFQEWASKHPVLLAGHIAAYIGMFGTLTYLAYRFHKKVCKRRDNPEAYGVKHNTNMFIGLVKAVSAATMVAGGIGFLANLTDFDVNNWTYKLFMLVYKLFPDGQGSKKELEGQRDDYTNAIGKLQMESCTPGISQDRSMAITVELSELMELRTSLQNLIDDKGTWKDRLRLVRHTLSSIFTRAGWETIAGTVIALLGCVTIFFSIGYVIGGRKYVHKGVVESLGIDYGDFMDDEEEAEAIAERLNKVVIESFEPKGLDTVVALAAKPSGEVYGPEGGKGGSKGSRIAAANYAAGADDRAMDKKLRNAARNIMDNFDTITDQDVDRLLGKMSSKLADLDDQLSDMMTHGSPNNPDHVKRYQDILKQIDYIEDLRDRFYDTLLSSNATKGLLVRKGGRTGKKRRTTVELDNSQPLTYICSEAWKVEKTISRLESKLQRYSLWLGFVTINWTANEDGVMVQDSVDVHTPLGSFGIATGPSGCDKSKGECVHVSDCPSKLKTSPYDLCNKSCGGHHCTHFAGCTPAHPEEVAPNTPKPSMSRRACKTCKAKHTKCTKCGTVHCGSKGCPGKNSKEVSTPYKAIPVEDISGSILMLKSTDGFPISSAWKVKWSGKTWLVTCRHQLAGCPDVVDPSGNTFSIPYADARLAEPKYWKFPFVEQDIALLDWEYFKGKCPKVVRTFSIRYVARDTDLSQQMVFVGYEPTTEKVVVGGLIDARVDSSGKRIEHAVDTTNGSCGSAYLGAYDGQTLLIGMHAGTYGGTDKPNYGYTFRVPKN